MQKKKLCPICKTGRESLLLDRQSPGCPYLSMHNGKSCEMFVCLDGEKKKNVLKRIIEKCFHPQKG